MNSETKKSSEEASFGTIPSKEIRQLDHKAWWGIFMRYVEYQPANPANCRLSSDPVHLIHGQCFSVSDCAEHAILDAYEENQVQIAKNYEEQAKRLIRSYDRRVYTQVSHYMDHLRIKYLFLCTGCMMFGAILAFLHLKREGSGNGLLLLSILSILLSCLAGVLAGLTTWKKRRILFGRETDNPADAQ